MFKIEYEKPQKVFIEGIDSNFEPVSETVEIPPCIKLYIKLPFVGWRQIPHRFINYDQAVVTSATFGSFPMKWGEQ